MSRHAWTRHIKGGNKGRKRESELQEACVKWFRLQYPKLRRHLVSNLNGIELEGTAKDKAKKWRQLESEGAVKGAADLQLNIPSGDMPGLFIELKTPKGTQSPEQKEFEADMVAAGYGYAMPRSLGEFMRVVKSYLERGEY